jgi:hypothetical protein
MLRSGVILLRLCQLFSCGLHVLALYSIIWLNDYTIIKGLVTGVIPGIVRIDRLRALSRPSGWWSAKLFHLCINAYKHTRGRGQFPGGERAFNQREISSGTKCTITVTRRWVPANEDMGEESVGVHLPPPPIILYWSTTLYTQGKSATEPVLASMHN